MTPPPWIFLSFLYTLYGQVAGKSSEVAIELSILVFLDSYNMWLMKIKESQQFQFFASYEMVTDIKNDVASESVIKPCIKKQYPLVDLMCKLLCNVMR